MHLVAAVVVLALLFRRHGVPDWVKLTAVFWLALVSLALLSGG